MFQKSQMEKQSKALMDQYQRAMASSQANQFPFNKYYGDYENFMKNPMAYLQKMSAFMASQNYAKEAQKRRNAGQGQLDAGYGDQLMTNAVGANANDWYKTTGAQLGQAAGVSFNPASGAMASAGSLPYALNNQNQAYGYGSEVVKGIGEILKGSNSLPDIFKNLG